MNIRKLLQFREFSKQQALEIRDWIDNDAHRMDKLMQLFLNENYRITQRAAYPLLFISNKNPKLFEPYLEQMVDNMTDDKHDAVIRNTLRLLQDIDMPETLEGKVFDKSIHYLKSPKYPVAIRVFAMTIVTNICIKYPELKAEVLPLLKDILEISESPGMHSRGKKMLAVLKSIPDQDY